MGKPKIRYTDPVTNEEKEKDNPIYWQGMYEFIRSSVEVAKLDPARKDLLPLMKENLRKLLVIYPNPPLYQTEFLQLRQELLPDWNPNEVPATTPAAKAATPATRQNDLALPYSHLAAGQARASAGELAGHALRHAGQAPPLNVNNAPRHYFTFAW